MDFFGNQQKSWLRGGSGSLRREDNVSDWAEENFSPLMKCMLYRDSLHWDVGSGEGKLGSVTLLSCVLRGFCEETLQVTFVQGCDSLGDDFVS